MIPASISFAGCSLDGPLPGGDLFHCPSCGITFRYPRLSKNELDALYWRGNGNKWRTTVHSRRDWEIAKTWILNNYHFKGNRSILDVGCFDGSFLESFGSGYKLYGIEINPEARDRARATGIQLIGTDFATIDNIKMSFDVVTSFDVIEHVHNPMDYLVKLSSLTQRNGIVILATGNTNARTWRLLKSRYWYSAISEHLSFINPTWCKWVAPRIGLELKKIVFFSHTKAKFRQQITETAKNLFYITCPTTFAWLRKIGFGNEENRNHKELLRYPPSWSSSRDHFISLFIKK